MMNLSRDQETIKKQLQELKNVDIEEKLKQDYRTYKIRKFLVWVLIIIIGCAAMLLFEPFFNLLH